MTGASVTDRSAAPRPPQLAVDPRIAARWIAVRRDQNRRRWKVAVAALGAVTVAIGAWIVLHSSVLAVHQVVVRGTGHTDRGSVVAAAHLDGRPMIDVDSGSTKGRLLALPWVGAARVRRHWPTTVTIDIVERVPFARTGPTAATATGTRAGTGTGTDTATVTAGPTTIVAADGRVLAVGDEAARVLETVQPPLPSLDGLPTLPAAVVAGATLSPPARSLLLVLKGLQAAPLPPSVNRPGAAPFTVDAVTLGADGTVRASLGPGPISAVFGTTDDLDAKLMALRSVLAQLAAAASTGPTTGPTTIDVRVAAAPVLTDGK